MKMIRMPIIMLMVFLMFQSVSNAQPLWTLSGANIFNNNSPGFVGIGIPVPLQQLHVSTTGTVCPDEDGGPGYTAIRIARDCLFGVTPISTFWDLRVDNNSGTIGGGFSIYSVNNSYSAFHILGNGNVGIGTTAPIHKLDVCGTIAANEVIVKTGCPPPDFVFESNYSLMSLTDLRNYILVNKHLPSIPAGKVFENEISLGAMDMALLQQMEELALYILQLDEQNKLLLQKIKALEELISEK